MQKGALKLCATLLDAGKGFERQQRIRFLTGLNPRVSARRNGRQHADGDSQSQKSQQKNRHLGHGGLLSTPGCGTGWNTSFKPCVQPYQGGWEC
jgi:hypothetical protein